MAATPPVAPRHIRLTSHPGQGATGAPAIVWGAADPMERGPVVGTTTNRRQRNVIGTHSGSYGVYRALAVAAGSLPRGHRADLTNTAPTDPIGPYPPPTRSGATPTGSSRSTPGARACSRCSRRTSNRATTSARRSR